MITIQSWHNQRFPAVPQILCSFSGWCSSLSCQIVCRTHSPLSSSKHLSPASCSPAFSFCPQWAPRPVNISPLCFYSQSRFLECSMKDLFRDRKLRVSVGCLSNSQCCFTYKGYQPMSPYPPSYRTLMALAAWAWPSTWSRLRGPSESKSYKILMGFWGPIRGHRLFWWQLHF